jgi:hypothetical protein
VLDKDSSVIPGQAIMFVLFLIHNFKVLHLDNFVINRHQWLIGPSSASLMIIVISPDSFL